MNSRYNLRSRTQNQQPDVPPPVVVPIQIPKPAPSPPVPVQLYTPKPPPVFIPPPPPLPPPVCPDEASLMENWHWNLYQTIGLTVESSQQQVDHVLRHTLRKYHPDKTPGKERVYSRVDFIYKTLGAKAARYRKLLSSTYVPHGGGLLDERAMAAYISGKKPSYAPERLPCVLPENGPRFVERDKTKRKASESIIASWRVYGTQK